MKRTSRRAFCLVVIVLAVANLNPIGADCPNGNDYGQWFHAATGQVPQADAYGVEQPPGNQPLYACRAEFGGGCHIGKIRAGFHGCHIPYGGLEHEVASYDLPLSQLTWITNLDVTRYRRLALAFHPGKEGYGNYRLDMCRATYPAGTTGVHIGKIRPQFSGCHIAWGGVEIPISRFDVADLRR